MKTLIYSKIYSNAIIYDWMIISQDRIEDIGMGHYQNIDCDHVIYINDKYIIPGLIDAHIHVAMLGESKSGSSLDLKECSSFKELNEKLADFARKSSSQWIVGEGWDQRLLGRSLTSKDIDAVISDRPVALFRNCLHICVINQFAIDILFKSQKANVLSEILSSEKDKKRSELFVDIDENGDITGILKEGALFSLKETIQASRSSIEIDKFFTDGLDICLKNGITSVQTNDFFGAWTVYKNLYQCGKVPIRVYLTVPVSEIMIEDVDVDALDSHGIPLANDSLGLLSVHRVKLFIDGSLGASTAALREEYSDQECSHGNHGILIQKPEVLKGIMSFAHEQGYRMEIHVIGDRAVEVALDSLESCGITREDRPILTHCQVVPPDLTKRMAKMGVIANVQPSFVTSDAFFATSRLGSKRLPYAYAWKTLLEEKIHVCGGSDAPVENANPFWGLHSAIFRSTSRTLNSNQKPSSIPVFGHTQRLSFIEAFDLYTKNAAFAAGDEECLGQLKKGFKADFVVIDKEIWKSDNSSDELIDNTWNLLLDCKVHQVYVDGILRYSAE